MSRLQLLTTKFENLQMKEDESVHEFHMNVLDFANQFDALGEKLSEEKLIRKILRSLPKKFDMKVTTIEETQDISSMKVDELLGSLQTFELVLMRDQKRRTKALFLSQTLMMKEWKESWTKKETSLMLLSLLEANLTMC
ncbi:hypothetical protein P8452_17405 [Trifolium repens]|nr:hypothetical protein P8452_17405 [Trifolium repens]